MKINLMQNIQTKREGSKPFPSEFSITKTRRNGVWGHPQQARKNSALEQSEDIFLWISVPKSWLASAKLTQKSNIQTIGNNNTKNIKKTPTKPFHQRKTIWTT